MAIQRRLRSGGAVSPLYTVAGVLVLGGAIGLWRREPAVEAESAATEAPSEMVAAAPAPLTAAEACRNVGYLCSELERSEAARDIFGDDVVDHYLNAARVEQETYDSVVHPWDRERYLERG